MSGIIVAPFVLSAAAAGLAAAGLAATGLGSALVGTAAGMETAGKWLADWREAAVAREAARREVAVRTARIEAFQTALAGARERYGPLVTVTGPEPVKDAGQDAAWLRSWCARTDAALTAAEARLAREIAAAVTAQLMGGQVAGRRLASAAEALAAATRSDRADDPVPDPGPAHDQRDEIAQSLVRVLARLLPDATAQDQEVVTAAAAEVAATTIGEARARLDDVRVKVERANERARARRAAAVEAARLLHDLDGCQGEGVEATRAGLAEVVVGRRALDDALRAQAQTQREAMDAEAGRRYVLDAVVATMDDLGYAVAPGFETLTAQGGTLRLTRGDWRDHAVNVVIDGAAAQLRAAVVRTAAGPQSDDQRRLDVERERQWCDAFEVARARLAEAGIDTDVVLATPPGQQAVPLAEPRPAARTKEPHAERRERER